MLIYRMNRFSTWNNNRDTNDFLDALSKYYNEDTNLDVFNSMFRRPPNSETTIDDRDLDHESDSDKVRTFRDRGLSLQKRKYDSFEVKESINSVKWTSLPDDEFRQRMSFLLNMMLEPTFSVSLDKRLFDLTDASAYHSLVSLLDELEISPKSAGTDFSSSPTELTIDEDEWSFMSRENSWFYGDGTKNERCSVIISPVRNRYNSVDLNSLRKNETEGKVEQTDEFLTNYFNLNPILLKFDPPVEESYDQWLQWYHERNLSQRNKLEEIDSSENIYSNNSPDEAKSLEEVNVKPDKRSSTLSSMTVVSIKKFEPEYGEIKFLEKKTIDENMPRSDQLLENLEETNEPKEVIGEVTNVNSNEDSSSSADSDEFSISESKNLRKNSKPRDSKSPTAPPVPPKDEQGLACSNSLTHSCTSPLANRRSSNVTQINGSESDEIDRKKVYQMTKSLSSPCLTDQSKDTPFSVCMKDLKKMAQNTKDEASYKPSNIQNKKANLKKAGSISKSTEFVEAELSKLDQLLKNKKISGSVNINPLKPQTPRYRQLKGNLPNINVHFNTYKPREVPKPKPNIFGSLKVKSKEPTKKLKSTIDNVFSGKMFAKEYGTVTKKVLKKEAIDNVFNGKMFAKEQSTITTDSSKPTKPKLNNADSWEDFVKRLQLEMDNNKFKTIAVTKPAKYNSKVPVSRRFVQITELK